jgi:hypothetical protein
MSDLAQSTSVSEGTLAPSLALTAAEPARSPVVQLLSAAAVRSESVSVPPEPSTPVTLQAEARSQPPDTAGGSPAAPLQPPKPSDTPSRPSAATQLVSHLPNLLNYSHEGLRNFETMPPAEFLEKVFPGTTVAFANRRMRSKKPREPKTLMFRTISSPNHPLLTLLKSANVSEER